MASLPKEFHRHLLLASVLVFGAALAAHSAQYWPFLSDDTLISLRYAERLVHGAGLTWSDGERVEGYTDLLWVLLVALGGALRLDLIQTARALGFLGTLLAIVAVGLDPRTLKLSLPRLIGGGTLLVLSAPMAVWAIGGLEHGFMTGVLALGLVALLWGAERTRPTTRELLLVGAPFACLALLRADGVALLGSALPGLLAAREPWRERLRGIVVVSIPTAIALVAQLAFRWVYYGQLIPNTALVKVSFNQHRLEEGILHVQNGFTPLYILLAAALVGAVVGGARSTPRQRLVVPVALLLGWSAYLATVGGDIFPAWRQLLFVLIPLSLLVAEGMDQLWNISGGSRVASVAAIGLLGFSHYLAQLHDPENVRAKTERWEWDGYSVGNLLRRAFGEQRPLLAVDAAGALPYWSKLPSLDMLGLNDFYLPRHPPLGFGRMGIGHELGDGAYVMRRSPDIIAFNNAAGYHAPMFIGGRQLVAMKDFRERYQLIRVQGEIGNRAVGELYLKRFGGPISISVAPDRVYIPAYFLSEPAAYPARLDERGKLVLPLEGPATVTVPSLSLNPGIWRLSVDPPSADISVGFRCMQRSALSERRSGQRSIAIEPNTRLTLTVALARADAPPVELRGLMLERQPSDGAGEPSDVCPAPAGIVEAKPVHVEAQLRQGADWQSPHHIVFDWTGLAIDWGELKHPDGIELSVDGNDDYWIRGYRGVELVWQERISAEAGSRGMVTRRFTLAQDIGKLGLERLSISPISGDGYFSLGSLRLE